jgi:diacylglycerol kinase family enzyme
VVGRLTPTRLALAATGTLIGSHRPVRRVEALRVPAVTVHPDGDHEIAVDGEMVGAAPMRFSVLPGALRVVVPDPHSVAPHLAEWRHTAVSGEK